MHLNMAYADEPASLECIHKSELFPKKQLVTEDDSLHVPFPLLCGEAVEFLGRTSDGVIALSNFRLLIRCKDSFINISLGLIESVECRDIFYLSVNCKDATVVRCSFNNNDSCQDWFKRITAKISPPKELSELFAFAFYAWCMDQSPCLSDHESCYLLCQQEDSFRYSFGREVDRMKLNLKSAWRISYINETFDVCSTYPKNHIVPASITDEQLKKVADFRALKRFPSVVWRDQRNGAVLVRCSQPELGWFGWRSIEDETLLQAIPLACLQNPGSFQNQNSLTDDSSASESGSQNGDLSEPTLGNNDNEKKKMLIIDCRSYDYYPSCEIQFMNLANIHSIRKSFLALRTLCSSPPDQASWLSSLENTKWLSYLAGIIKAANVAVSAIDKEGRPVLVHCSDGWDRTTQIIALSELLLDPYYRTLEGFQVLVEREWLDFGHKFADRCGNGVASDDLNERCPVFLQWLDCVFQLYKQFPCAFQFNEAYLVKLVQHTYSNLFGTFLCNFTQDRLKEELSSRTSSIWTLLHYSNKKFHNHLYCPTLEQQVLIPSSNIRNLHLWTSVYLSNNSSTTSPEETTNTTDQQEQENVQEQSTSNLQKTRSCENLAANVENPIPSPSRRKSDPNITLDSFDQASHLSKDTDHNSSTLSIQNESKEEKDATQNKVVENGDVDDDSRKCENICNGHLSDHEDAKLSDSDSISDGHDKITDRRDVTNICANGHVHCDENDKMNESDIQNHRVIGDLNNLHLENSDDTADRIKSLKLMCNQTLSKKSTESDKIIESSTDTLIDEDLDRKKYEPDDCFLPVNGHTVPKVSKSVDNLVKSENRAIHKLKLLEEHQCSLNGDKIGPYSNLDCVKDPGQFLKFQCFQMTQSGPLRLNCGSNGCNTFSGIPNGSSSGMPLYPTPNGSRTPNSTCPPTPGTDAKSSETQLQRQLIGVGRHLDIDGLTTFNDPVQQRMLQIEAEYKKDIQVLQSQLSAAYGLLMQHASACSGAGRCLLEAAKDDIVSLPESPGSGEFASIGAYSNAASDVSWEHIDKNESKVTKWVPDHAVTHCAQCESAFGIFNRRHHCRNCGNVFCHACTSFKTTIPNQNINTEERVCRKCYTALYQNDSLYENGALLDRPMAAAASN
ncbi:hypothetical protein KUTeg_010288 [Tegillarca granosa]|uniref:phosphatidylinositol-3,5-bisphosphate 3-phosphatase n=1 Tax=Tegillarca granosa TaxID=220873 RepID=A0ABQ9FBA0_TEGGR|nr:hypothetical protein KUTeg_010288 [Tegillarca granosa]